MADLKRIRKLNAIKEFPITVDGWKCLCTRCRVKGKIIQQSPSCWYHWDSKGNCCSTRI